MTLHVGARGQDVIVCHDSKIDFPPQTTNFCWKATVSRLTRWYRYRRDETRPEWGIATGSLVSWQAYAQGPGCCLRFRTSEATRVRL